MNRTTAFLSRSLLFAAMVIFASCAFTSKSRTSVKWDGKEVMSERSCQSYCIEPDASGEGCRRYSPSAAAKCQQYINKRPPDRSAPHQVASPP